MDQILQSLQQAGIIIATVSIGALATVASFYIRKGAIYLMKRSEAIDDAKTQQLTKEAINRINDLAQKAVGSLEQTVAGALREAVKDGKVDRAELLALGVQAVNEVYNQLTPEVIAAAQVQISDIRRYIEDTVEDSLLHLKVEMANKETTETV